MNENQLSTYKTEKGAFYNRVMELDDAFKKANFRYRFWDFLRRNAIRGFWPPYDFDSRIMSWLKFFMNFIFFIFLLVTFFNLLVAVIVYGALHLALIIISSIFRNINEKKLIALEPQINYVFDEYANKQYDQYRITDRNSVVFDDGMVVTNGSIKFPMCRDYGNIQILQFSNFDDEYYYKSLKKSDPSFCFNKNISSVQFTKNFGVLTSQNNHLRALSYLSPTVQVDMINHIKDLNKYRRINISGGVMSIETDRHVRPPSDFYLYFSGESVTKHLDEIDRHCRETLEMGLLAYSEIQQMPFLKGTL